MNKSTYKIYMDEVEKAKILSRKEERGYLALLKTGNKKAFHKLYNANLKFVVKTAMKYMNQGIEIMDLIQAGNIGLAQALDKYDIKKDERFITYAVWWIRQKILEELAHQGRSVKISAGEITIKSKIDKFKCKFMNDHEREPNDHEIAEKLNLSKKAMKRQQLLDGEISLNKSVVTANGGQIELIDMIQDNTTMSPDSFHLANVEDKIIDFLDKAEAKREIDDTEKDVVKMTYGIEYGVPFTLEEIKDKHNIAGREQARKKNLTALKKLKSFNQTQMHRNEKHLSLDMIEV